MPLNLTNHKVLYKQLATHSSHDFICSRRDNEEIVLECLTCGEVLLAVAKPEPRPLFSCLPTNCKNPIYFHADNRLKAESYVIDVLKLGLSSVVLTTAKLQDIEDLELYS